MMKLEMSMWRALVAGLLCTALPVAAEAAPFLIVGLDQKQVWDDTGATVLFPTGMDRLAILDIAHPEKPRLVAALPLENSVAGPPVNIAISPNDRLALLADSYTVVAKQDVLEIVPTDKLFVIDLAARKPRLVQTLHIGKQPSGISINPAGTMALVGYRADNAVGVLKIDGERVSEIARVPLGDSISHVAFTPDGHRAVAVHHDSAKVTVLDIDGDKVVPSGNRVDTTPGAYVADVTPDGRLALTIDKQFVSVIDMQAQPPRRVDTVAISPGGEGLAISPRGDLAVSVSIRASNGDKRSPEYHENGAIDVLEIHDNEVRRIKTIEVGRIPESAAFSPDGRYLYVTSFLDKNIWIFRVDGTEVTDTGTRFGLPGRPASGRASPASAAREGRHR